MKVEKKSKGGIPVWVWIAGAIVFGFILSREQGNGSNEPKYTSTNTPTPPLGVGSTKVSLVDGMEMVYVPGVEFEMGSNENDNEKPIHTIYLDGYWIDKYEVTNEMFTMFVEEMGYQTDAEKEGSSFVYADGIFDLVKGADWAHPQGPGSNLNRLDAHPVVHVSWNDANAYCEWSGKRLPTEAEWEKAARGTDGRTYPWGEGIDSSLANYNLFEGGTTLVGSYLDGASPYGALDMAGNVWEWVADWYDEDYYSISLSNNPQSPSSGKYRVLRSGSWYDSEGYLRSAYRNVDLPDLTNPNVGFRCVTSP